MTDILVLDLGTTYFKASVFADTGELRALSSSPIPSERIPHGRHQLSVDAFKDAIVGLVLKLEARLPSALRGVEAVTFSTQTNSFLLLDTEENALTPIIVWDDRRAYEIAEDISETLCISMLYETTGVPKLSPEFMAAKLLWMQRQSPGIFNRTDRVALISDYLTHWFTGRWVTEAGAAGLTGLLDIRQITLWPDALDRFELKPEWMPDVVRAGTDAGPIQTEVAKALHLPEQCRFVVGCLDQYAGAIGAGNVTPGAISETTGTVLATVRCSGDCAVEDGSDIFYGPGYAPGVCYRMVFGNIAANLLEHYRRVLTNDVSFADLDREASRVDAVQDALHLPVDRDELALMEVIEARAGDCGLGEMTRAILERVAFALYEQVQTLCDDAWPDTIVCAGGAARSTLWRSIKANVLGIPTVAVACPEPTSLGAAILAMASVSGKTVPQFVSTHVKPGEIVHPDTVEYNAYAAMRAANKP